MMYQQPQQPVMYQQPVTQMMMSPPPIPMYTQPIPSMNVYPQPQPYMVAPQQMYQQQVMAPAYGNPYASRGVYSDSNAGYLMSVRS